MSVPLARDSIWKYAFAGQFKIRSICRVCSSPFGAGEGNAGWEAEDWPCCAAPVACLVMGIGFSGAACFRGAGCSFLSFDLLAPESRVRFAAGAPVEGLSSSLSITMYFLLPSRMMPCSLLICMNLLPDLALVLSVSC